MKEELPSEQQQQYDYITGEIQPFLEGELYEQGIERLDLILAGVPDDEAYRKLRGGVIARRAELRLELDDNDGAWDDAQKAMNLGWYDAAVHSIAGWAMYNRDELDHARASFDRALELDADRASSLIGRALTLIDLEEWDLARIDLSRVIQQDDEHALAYATRSDVHLNLGTVEAATRDIKRARQLAPRDADYAVMDARLCLVAGEVEEAAQAIAVAVRDDEASLEALLLRSHIRMMGGDTKGARKDAIRASNAYPDEAFAFVMLGQLQLAQGNAALALKAAERAVQLDPTLPDGYLVRAAALELDGDSAAAAEDLERAADERFELGMFLLGPAQRFASDSFAQGFSSDVEPPRARVEDVGGPNIPPMGAGPGLGGPGFNPMAMAGQIFDDEGNVKPAFKPIMKMALKNAPSILKNLPPSMLQNMGGIDPAMLDQVDMSEISEEQMEAQLKMLYKMMKSGVDPRDLMKNPPGSGDE